MKIPKSIKVAGHVYKIEPQSEGWSTDSDLWGDCNREKLVIRYHDGLPESRMIESVLHEIIHAIYYEYDVGTAKTEEEVVTRMSTGLHQVLSDAKDLRFLF